MLIPRRQGLVIGGNNLVVGLPAQAGGGITDPTDISDLAMWYDASDVSTLWQNAGGTSAVTADGQSVARWDDKSGNSRHLTGNSPTYQTNEINGLSILRFFFTPYTTIASAPTFATELTFLAVFKPTNNGGALLTGDPNGPLWDRVSVSSNRMRLHRSTNGPTFGPSTTTVATNTTYVVGVRYDTGTCEFFLNGAADGTDTDTHSDFAISEGVAGGHNGGDLLGDLGELIAYGRALTNTELQDLEDYLGAKWGITVS